MSENLWWFTTFGDARKIQTFEFPIDKNWHTTCISQKWSGEKGFGWNTLLNFSLMVGNKVCRVATYVIKFLQDTFRVVVVFDLKNEQCVWKMTRRQTDEFCKFIFCSWKTPDVWCVVSYYYQNGDMDDFRTRIDLISMLRFTSQGREEVGLKIPLSKCCTMPPNPTFGLKEMRYKSDTIHPCLFAFESWKNLDAKKWKKPRRCECHNYVSN